MELKQYVIYAGQEKKNEFIFYEFDGVKIGEKQRYSKKLFLDINIGYIFEVQFEDEKVIFNKNQKPKFIDFENKKQLISKWKAEDLIFKNLSREAIKVKDIHRYEDFKEFKKWFKTKNTQSKQLIIADLINFLNN